MYMIVGGRIRSGSFSPLSLELVAETARCSYILNTSRVRIQMEGGYELWRSDAYEQIQSIC